MKYILSLIVITAALLVISIQTSFGDEDGEEHRSSWFKGKPDVAPVDNALYEAECSSCHFAYPPGLLPEQSWKKLLANLQDHFGENAELSDVDRAGIENYLLANSADKSNHRRSQKIMRSLSDADAPLRITDLNYFQRKHDEIPTRMVKDNPKVGSFSQCDACHQNAKEGNFSEHQVRIPGYGQWDD